MSIKERHGDALQRGASRVVNRSEARLKKLLDAWSSAITSALGPKAWVKAPETSWDEMRDIGSGSFEVNDTRLPNYAILTVTAEAHGDGDANLNVDLTLPDNWLRSTSEKIRGPGEFRLVLDGDVEYLHLDADKHAKDLMDVLRPVLALEAQNRQAAGRFNKALPSLLEAVRTALIRSGTSDTVRISTLPLFGNGNTVQTDQGTPFLALQLYIYGVLSKKDRDKKDTSRALRRSEVARTHDVVSEVFGKFDEDNVLAALSTKGPVPTSDDAYSIAFYLHFKDGPTPSVRLARENHPEKRDITVKTNDRLRAATIDKNNVVLKTGAADAASKLEARLKKLLRAWSDVILTNVGPSAKMKQFDTFAYEGLGENKESSSGWSVIMDKRLPPHSAIDMTGETQADGSTTLRLRLALPYEWVGFTSEKVRDSFKFDVTLKGDVDQLHLSATKHVKALMGVLGPVLAAEEQNKQAMTRFKGALQLLLDAIRASLVKSGVQDTARIHVKPTGGGDVNLIQVEDGVPFWPADLNIQRLKSKKAPSRGNLDQQDSSLAAIHAAVSEAFESFDQGDVRAVLSARYDDHSSEKEYTNYFYLYFKDGPDPKIRIAREGAPTMKNDDPLRAATIKLAHENPSLRKHLLPLLTKTASALDGWEKKVKPGSSYPVVYVREQDGETYRVAPSIRGDKWTLDVYALTGWERHHPKDGDTPEEAASFLR